MDLHDIAIKHVLDNISSIAPIYRYYNKSDKSSDDEDDRNVIDYEVMSSISKSLKIKQLKLLHKQIIDITDELYKFSDELDMSNKEECSCKISVFEAIKELNKITEYLTKQTLDDKHDAYK